jgi:hypothetical protein
MKEQYLARLVNLTPQDYRTVRRLADEKGLGSKGFSAALRMIIREWLAFRQLLDQEVALRLSDGTSPIIREWQALQRPASDPTPPTANRE